jgi:hypothetical protein
MLSASPYICTNVAIRSDSFKHLATVYGRAGSEVGADAGRVVVERLEPAGIQAIRRRLGEALQVVALGRTYRDPPPSSTSRKCEVVLDCDMSQQ